MLRECAMCEFFWGEHFWVAPINDAIQIFLARADGTNGSRRAGRLSMSVIGWPPFYLQNFATVHGSPSLLTSGEDCTKLPMLVLGPPKIQRAQNPSE
jgi:hypothetical protein